MENRFSPTTIVAFILVLGGIFVGDAIDQTVGFFVILLGCIVAAISLIQKKNDKK